MRAYMRIATYSAIACMLCLGAGCSDSRQKMGMKGVKINMITPENVHGVMAPDDDNIWITGNYGIIYHSSDQGASWSRQPSGVKESIIVDGCFLDAQTGWVAGVNGTVLHTTDGGRSWVRQDAGTQRHLFGISFADRQQGWVVGEWSTILHTADGGATWEPQGEESDKIYNNVCFVDNDTGWVVGERGIILHTADGGATWTRQEPPEFVRESLEDELANPRPSLFCVYFLDRRRGWSCGIDGTMLKTADGGATWEILPARTELTLYTVFVRGGRGWAVGDKGAYLMSKDGGTTWELKKDVIKTKVGLRDVFFSSPDRGWIVGANGTVVHTTDGGETWKFLSGLSYAMEFFQMPKELEFKGMVTE